VTSVRLRLHAVRVLAIFVATLCVTLLAPFVASAGYAEVCSAQGVRLVAVDGAPAEVHATHPGDPTSDSTAHCPLCMPAAAPPSAIAWDFTPVQPHAHALRAIPAARLAGLVGAPLPARGPPTLS
jgi:hypothetical protein